MGSFIKVPPKRRRSPNGAPRQEWRQSRRSRGSGPRLVKIEMSRYEVRREHPKRRRELLLCGFYVASAEHRAANLARRDYPDTLIFLVKKEGLPKNTPFQPYVTPAFDHAPATPRDKTIELVEHLVAAAQADLLRS